jgi:mannose-6-phosphate isomerase-like protein (cupin superfamily)
MKKILTATILVSIGVLIGWHAATWSHSQAMAQAMAQAVARSAAQNSGESKAPTVEGYILERDAEVAKAGPAPHSGPGRSTGYSFFEKAAGFKQVFRKRALHPGAAIGYHLQKEDEVYYILSGEGVMQMNDKEFPVKPGDAILTRPGSSHGLKQTGKDDLTLIIVYER